MTTREFSDKEKHEILDRQNHRCAVTNQVFENDPLGSYFPYFRWNVNRPWLPETEAILSIFQPLKKEKIHPAPSISQFTSDDESSEEGIDPSDFPLWYPNYTPSSNIDDYEICEEATD